MWWPLVLVQEACLGEKSASVLSFERIFPYSMLSWSEDLHQGAQQRGKNAGIGAQQADAWFGSFCGRVRVVKVVMVAKVVHTSPILCASFPISYWGHSKIFEDAMARGAQREISPFAEWR